jgi:hypothetical protein
VTEVPTLSDVDFDLIQFVERFHGTVGRSPTEAEIKQRFDFEDGVLEAFKNNPLVKKSFSYRGIIFPSPEDVFTAAQMHAAAAMTDIYDRRSDAKKLADIGVSTRQWSTWLQDDAFAQYINNRAEKLLENVTFEAHKGLLKGVRNGNVAAVKTAYEITGRYRPNEEAQIDIRRVLHTFIEVLQKHLKDPALLHNIAMELSQVASTESYATGLTNQMLGGAQEFRARTIAGQATPALPSFQADE